MSDRPDWYCIGRITHVWIDPGGRSVSIGDAAIKCARCGMTYLEFDALLPTKQAPND